MSKKRVHEVSDSDDEMSESTKAPPVKTSPRVEATPGVSSAYLSPKISTSNEDEDDEELSKNRAAGLEIVPFNDTEGASAESFISFEGEAEDFTSHRTPQAFKVVEEVTRATRKQLNRMFAFLIDRSPNETDNLETFVGYILERRLADAFMRMKFDKIRSLKKTLEERELRPEKQQFSNFMCGLMTMVDIIYRLSNENDGYCETDLMIFSDLGFDISDPSHVKMKVVLNNVLADGKLTVVSERITLGQATYRENIDFFKEIFSDVTSVSYQDAMKTSEEWTMKELMPTKWNANIQLCGEELPVEAYLICTEKNESILENRLEKVGDADNGEGDEHFTAAISTIRKPKQLVKLMENGHYEKDSDGAVVTVDPNRTVMAYKSTV
ncbi:hypothetical protein BIW11_08152 [Tropilaelaps mercedesae]|uniref:Uncharacterized protein n=1 Tax=Tropilaelaps mercedesae TaxID=418985 RepID=A0A1V9XQU5_9ACAR|nr:hypothetical protein BIW11_08152 [Tropilaelaps mercedesae]